MRGGIDVSIRFKVRGGFRPLTPRSAKGVRPPVSIRFEVRGGFRPILWVVSVALPFQSALRFAVVSDSVKKALYGLFVICFNPL